MSTSKCFGTAFSRTAALLLLLGAASVTPAQDVTGTIAGTVKDPSGALIPTATVSARNEGTAAVLQGVVQPDGSFSLKLTPGVYDVTVDANGFKQTRVTGVRVEVNTQSRADAVLGVGATADVVNVAAISDNVDTQTSTVKQTIGERAAVRS